MVEQAHRGAGILSFIGWRTNEEGREEFSVIVVFNDERPDLSLALATRAIPVRIITADQQASLEACKDALDNILNVYVEMAESGDCGKLEPEKEPQVIAARAALKGATP